MNVNYYKSNLYNVGGIIHDSSRLFIVGFFNTIVTFGLENVEACVMVFGLELCKLEGIPLDNIIFEVDLQLVINQINSGSCISL
jgi:hypothetical protein